MVKRQPPRVRRLPTQAKDTVHSIVEDVESGSVGAGDGDDDDDGGKGAGAALQAALDGRGVTVVDWDGHLALDAAERQAGQAATPERDRLKIVDHGAMLEAARSA